MLSKLAGEKFFGLDIGTFVDVVKKIRKQISTRILLVELGTSGIVVAELKVSSNYVQVDHVRDFTLPSEALERSIPSEPEKMGRLIHDFCVEEGIPASKAVVFVDDDTVYASLLTIPQAMTKEDALEYIYTSNAAIQIPIQVSQYDISLTPTEPFRATLPQSTFFYNALPKRYTDNILQTFVNAKLDVDSIRPCRAKLISLSRQYIQDLSEHEYVLLLDLRLDYTMAVVHTRYSTIYTTKITSIRKIDYEPSAKTVKNAATNNKSSTQPDSMQHPLSELDIRKIAQEINQIISLCKHSYPSLSLRKTILSGPNSLHANIKKLFEDALSIGIATVDSASLPYQILYASTTESIPSHIAASLIGGIACFYESLFPDNINIGQQSQSLQVSARPSDCQHSDEVYFRGVNHLSTGEKVYQSDATQISHARQSTILEEAMAGQESSVYNVGKSTNTLDILQQPHKEARRTGSENMKINKKETEAFTPTAQEYIVFPESILDPLVANFEASSTPTFEGSSDFHCLPKKSNPVEQHNSSLNLELMDEKQEGSENSTQLKPKPDSMVFPQKELLNGDQTDVKEPGKTNQKPLLAGNRKSKHNISTLSMENLLSDFKSKKSLEP